MRRVSQERALAPHTHEPLGPKFFEMMRERRSRDVELRLDLARDHALRVSGQEQAKDLQPYLGAEGGEHVGIAGGLGRRCLERAGSLGHISIMVELWNQCKRSGGRALRPSLWGAEGPRPARASPPEGKARRAA